MLDKSLSNWLRGRAPLLARDLANGAEDEETGSGQSLVEPYSEPGAGRD